MPPSRHVGYAVQWWGLALAALVMMLVGGRRLARDARRAPARIPGQAATADEHHDQRRQGQPPPLHRIADVAARRHYAGRSEERRVGEEGGSRGWVYR